jgi:hypothetical protein
MLPCFLWSLANEIEIRFRRFSTFLGLLLKSVEHVNGVTKFDGISSPKRAIPCLIVRAYLNRVAKVAFHAVCVIGLLVMLGKIERIAKSSCTSSGIALRSFLDEPTHAMGF